VIPRGVATPRPCGSHHPRQILSARGATPTVALTALCALMLSGCGSGAPQTAHEPKGTFTLKVLHAAFPAKQSISKPASLVVRVRNTGASAAPNVAVTLDSFYYTENFPELAADKRPVWVIERGPGQVPRRPVKSQAISPPGGGQTAYVNTWALGPLGPGQSRTFQWNVVPVKAGMHTVHYTIAAGLGGHARAVNADGAPVQGQFTVDVAALPPARQVDPNTGQVVPGTYP